MKEKLIQTRPYDLEELIDLYSIRNNTTKKEARMLIYSFFDLVFETVQLNKRGIRFPQIGKMVLEERRPRNHTLNDEVFPVGAHFKPKFEFTRELKRELKNETESF